MSAVQLCYVTLCYETYLCWIGEARSASEVDITVSCCLLTFWFNRSVSECDCGHNNITYKTYMI